MNKNIGFGAPIPNNMKLRRPGSGVDMSNVVTSSVKTSRKQSESNIAKLFREAASGNDDSALLPKKRSKKAASTAPKMTSRNAG